MSDKDDFASRWARRKRAVAEEEAAPKAPLPAPEPQDEETEAEALERLGLPDPDTLGEGDDFSGFMKASVPALLRRRALRKLWATNPVLANVDGLVEYGENYASPDLIPEVVATAYKVGRGFVKKVVETTEAHEANDGQARSEEETSAPIESTSAQVPQTDEPAERGALSHQAELEEKPAESDSFAQERGIALQPRRMRFRTET